MTDSQPLFDRLEALLDHGKLPDWDDVVRRAEEPRRAARPARRSRCSYLARRIVPAFVLAAAVIAVGLVAPWNGNPSLAERALAAIGNGPVVHAVLRHETGYTYIDLATGRERPQLMTTEIWFDSERHIEHQRFETDGRFEGDVLQTPAGFTSSTGKQRYPSKGPRLDPALAGFVDGYRSALEKGVARVIGEGTLNGHSVTWIELPFTKMEKEHIAVDNGSSLPLRVEFRNPIVGSSGSYDVLSIETLPEGQGNFTPPRLKQSRPMGLAGMEETPASLSELVAALPRALWDGKSISGLALSRRARGTLGVYYGKRSTVAARSGPGIVLKYGQGSPYALGGRSGKAFVRLEETTLARPNYFWYLPFLPLGGRLMAICAMHRQGLQARSQGRLRECEGYIVRRGVYVHIRAASRDLMLTAARSLEPISKP